ncbi:MAG: hypothetical protein WCF13_12530, partial [Stellaceae bacterium]
AMGRNAGAEIFNVCTGQGTTVTALAQSMARRFDIEAETAFLPVRVSDVRYSVGDPAAAARHLGFTAGTSLEAGLDATVRALRTVNAI